MKISTKALLRAIFQLVLVANEEGEHHIFLDVAPHVNWITVQIFEGQWFDEADPTIKIDCNYTNADANKKLIEMKNTILKYIK